MSIPSHNRLNVFLKSVLASFGLQLCLVCTPLFAASDVVLIKESNIKPYARAIEGIKSSCSCSIRELSLEESDAIEQSLREHPAAVVTVGTNAFRKAEGITNFPLIYSMVIPADTAGPLPDNVSGVSMDIAPDEYLDAITGLFPGAKKIGLLYNPENTGPFVRDALAVARAKGIALIAKQATDSRRMPALLEELRKSIDIFWMIPDPSIIHPETLDYLMLVSFQSNLPVFSFSSKYIDRGAAAALAIGPFEMGAQAGDVVRQLITGAKGPLRPYARKGKLIVNRKVCAKLGVRINEDLARNAEKAE